MRQSYRHSRQTVSNFGTFAISKPESLVRRQLAPSHLLSRHEHHLQHDVRGLRSADGSKTKLRDRLHMRGTQRSISKLYIMYLGMCVC